MFQDLTTSLGKVLQEIVEIVASPTRRVFWPFLLVSVVIAFVVMWRKTGSPNGAIRKVREAFGLRVWLHRSSLMDLRLIIFNAVLKALLLPLIALSTLTVVLLVVSALTAFFGESSPVAWPRYVISITYTIVLFVAWDFSRYFLHMIAHEVPLVWEFHKIHHSAEVLTPVTIYRAHPVEVYLFTLRGALSTGTVTGVFYYFFGGQALQYEIMGANALGWLFNLLGGNLRHTDVWFTYPKLIEYVFMSPAQHQIHHGNSPHEYKSNYGAFLSLWDWIFGSLHLAAGREKPVTFGLKPADNNHDPTGMWSSVIGPFVAIAARFRALGRTRPVPEFNRTESPVASPDYPSSRHDSTGIQT